MKAKEQLQKEYLLLQKQLFWLELSYKEVKIIRLQDTYEVNQYTAFETLSTRYIKSIEFLLNKSFVSICNYEFESTYTHQELINNIQKRKLIDTDDGFRQLYDLRVKLEKEYISDNLTNHFEELYFSSKLLITTINNTLNYINKAIR